MTLNILVTGGAGFVGSYVDGIFTNKSSRGNQ
jgi:nucleoside-diphosphate-sugar epimerase